jgi:hypothetical protein
MAKVKIRVDMEEGWQWWPVTEVRQAEYEDAMGFEEALRRQLRKPMTLEVDEELVQRYQAVYKAHRELQEALENLYRIQEGLKPWGDQSIPDHTILKTE